MAQVLIHISLIYYVLCFGKYIYKCIYYKCTNINTLLQVHGIFLINRKKNQIFLMRLCYLINPNKNDEIKWRSQLHLVFGQMLMHYMTWNILFVLVKSKVKISQLIYCLINQIKLNNISLINLHYRANNL